MHGRIDSPRAPSLSVTPVYVGACLLLLAALVPPSPAAAQSGSSVPTNFQVEQFRPAPIQRTSLLGVSTSRVLPHLTPAAGLVVHMSDDPLQAVDRTGGRRELVPLIERQYTGEMTVGLGLFDRLQLGLALPLVFQRGEALVGADGTREPLPAASFADMRIVPRWRFLQVAGAGRFGFAASLPVHLPVGDADSYNSSGVVRGEPRLVADWQPAVGSRFAEARLAANVGFELRPERTVLDRVADDVLTWGVATELPVGPTGITAVGNLLGEWPPGVASSADGAREAASRHAIEAIGAVRADLGNELVLQVGGGSGLTDASGSPSLRLLASVEYVPASQTEVGGARSRIDSEFCRERGGEACRGEDRDGDGIPDALDECPDAPEDRDGFRDRDGCPDADNDADGFADSEDRCPNTPGVEARGGCPLVDSDGDGIADREDAAPYEPEDFDGHRDADGAPDPDNDGDGIPDLRDACPGAPERINGVDDEDGCPDEGDAQVAVAEGKIEIDDRIYFDSDRATIKQRSYSILEQVAALLRAESDIERVRIEGHTDARGEDLYNLALSQRRANAVRAFLIERGVDSSRLEARGYGESEPIATNETDEGRRENRRVEIRILSVREEGE